MKSSHPKITLLGSNSGNNLGDAAILTGVMDSITKELPNAEFYVPSTNPKFTNSNYKDKYNVKGIDVMPWTGSIRLFGIPTMYYMAKSDIALICDGIIFGKKLFNPLFNFLITLIFLVPWAKLTNCKIVCYSCGIGPFPGYWSKVFARFVINNSDLVIMRENDSKKLAEDIGVTKPIHVTGDAAFVNPVSSPERGLEVLKENNVSDPSKIFGINVTKYIDGWLGKDEQVKDKSSFLDTLADAIKKAQSELDQNDTFQPVLYCTHPMDEEFCNKLGKLIDAPTIDNSTYLSHDIQAAMSHSELFMGMRFHSVVLASAVASPIIGLVYAPKVRGFMRLLECEEFSLELKDITVDILSNTIKNGWVKRADLKATQQVHIDKLKAGARQAAVTIREKYFSGSAVKNAVQSKALG